MSSQMAYKYRTGKELAEFVWENFERKCFNCGEALKTVKTMHLDHTQPAGHAVAAGQTALRCGLAIALRAMVSNRVLH